jgi:clan AA aspartic protease (TIGR02281 family)
MRAFAALPALIAATCIGAAHARAEIYKWTDAQGRVHMTDDRSQVPPEHRESALQPEVPAREGRRPDSRTKGWNTVPLSHNSVWKTQSPEAEQPDQERRRHVLYVDRAGREMRVSVTLDGTQGIPFIVDTGAMLNTVPLWAVQRMGIELTPDLPRTQVSGIGGRAMEVPVVTIRRVQVGTAVVENVDMAVLSTMSKGLLGMPFFNHFRVQTDPVAGRLTLEDIDLDAVEGVHGGLGQKAWRSKFRQIYQQLEQIEKQRESIPSHFETAAGPYRERLEEREEYWRQQLEDLDDKATRAGVPASWRGD